VLVRTLNIFTGEYICAISVCVFFCMLPDNCSGQYCLSWPNSHLCCP